MAAPPFVRDDGGVSIGRGNCVVRAFAIASQRDPEEIAGMIRSLAKRERRGKRKRGRSTPGSGVYAGTIRKLAEALGAKWTPTMMIGSGCQVHVRQGEIPPGRVVLSLSKHVAAAIDGVVHDTCDPSRGGTRCVYGFWTFAGEVL